MLPPSTWAAAAMGRDVEAPLVGASQPQSAPHQSSRCRGLPAAFVASAVALSLAVSILVAWKAPRRLAVERLRGAIVEFQLPVGFRLTNRSLGLQASTAGFPSCRGIGHYGNDTYLQHTPNRRLGSSDGAGNSTHASSQNLDIIVHGNSSWAQKIAGLTPLVGVIVNRIHKDDHASLLQYMDMWGKTWPSWEKYLLTENNSQMAVLYVVTSFSAAQDEQSLAALEQRMALTACAAFDLHDSEGRLHTHSAYQTRGGRLVLITFVVYDDAVSRGYDEVGCDGYAKAYVYGTNWYAYAMMRMPIMDFFDVWLKIDWDVEFLRPMPNLLALLGQGSARPAVTVTHLLCEEPAWVMEGTQDWEHAAFAEASQQCSAGKTQIACRNSSACTSLTVIKSNFIGGHMAFWQSPEVLWLASRYEVFPNGMWKHRWGDQQFWSHVMAMLLSPKEQRELVVALPVAAAAPLFSTW